MQPQRSQLPIYTIIILSLFIALCPAILSNNYLRQDDLMWEIWPWMKVSDFGYLYYNNVFQLVRPICMLSFYLTDLISLNMHHSVYVRLMSISLIGILGILLYHWQLRFNSNKTLAVTFAISSFTLPAYQLFTATANYSLIITALLLTFITLFCWYRAYHISINKLKNKYLFLGCLLFYASLLNYPLSSMYGWTLLTICYLNSVTSARTLHSTRNNFIFFIAKLIVFMMAAYFMTIVLVHFLFHVNLHYGNRPGTFETAHFFTRLLWVFEILSQQSALWVWGNPYFSSVLPLIGICTLFCIALISTYKTNNNYDVKAIAKNTVLTLSAVFILFFMAYSPVLASSEHIITFRYALATMPILLYVIFWSVYQLTSYPKLNTILSRSLKRIGSLILVITTLFGVCYANWMMADGIVGPHTNDFRYIQQQLADKVIPLINQGKIVVIHAIDCDGGKNYQYPPNVPTTLEYGMRTCQYQQQVIGVIFHSLMTMGYPTNHHRHNSLIGKEKETQVTDAPWGGLIVSSDDTLDLDLHQYSTEPVTVVTIDMRKIPPYNRFDFYNSLLK